MSEKHESVAARSGRTPRQTDPITELKTLVKSLERANSKLVEQAEPIFRAGSWSRTDSSRPEDDPVAKGAAELAALVTTSQTVDEVAGRLGMDIKSVIRLIQRRGIYAIDVDGQWRLPQFQFDGDHVVSGIDMVFRALSPEVHPLKLYRWATTPHPDLTAEEDPNVDLTPLDWLRRGYSPDLIAELAQYL